MNYEFCLKRGKQLEEGFEIDGLVGELKVMVIKCHTAKDPQPKERLVVLSEEGKARVHDFAMIRRAHGKELIGDVYMFGAVGKTRVLNLVKKMLGVFDLIVGNTISDALNKALNKLFKKL